MRLFELLTTKTGYNSPWWWYDLRGFLILTFCYQNSIFRQLNFFSKGLRTPHLEAAIGSGSLLRCVMIYSKLVGRKLPEQIYAFDYEERMLVGAKLNFGRDKRFQLSQQDVGKMSYSDNFFQSISVANAIHSFPDADVALREIYRVLAPGGIAPINALLYPRGIWPLKNIADAIYKWGIRKGILTTPFELEDFKKKCLTAGFKIEELIVAGNCAYFVLRKPVK